MSFLTASWENLILANYTIDKSILLPYLPKGTELDTYNDDCYVSLVGFMFKNTRLLGIPIPFHRNFEEVNLRFYVKYLDNNNWKRGVVFIKELVPKPALTCIANAIYKEHYQTVPMNHHWSKHGDKQTISYGWTYDKLRQQIEVQASTNSDIIEHNTETEFITEHYFGYTKNKNSTFEYEVTHPKWEQFNVIQYSINVDFQKNYGNDFAMLNTQKPASVLLIKGSKITVENKRKCS